MLPQHNPACEMKSILRLVGHYPTKYLSVCLVLCPRCAVGANFPGAGDSSARAGRAPVSPRVAFKAYEKAVYDRNWIVAIDPINSLRGPALATPTGLAPPSSTIPFGPV